MGYRYINEIATRENIDAFLGLADLAAGGGQDASNVFELARKFTVSPPMQACEAQLRQDPQSAKLIAERHVVPPYDADSMRALPKGSLGHTYIRVLDGYGYDINFSLKRLSSTIWRPMLTTSTSACCRPTICITSSPDSASTTLVSSGS
jgi:ubiquinone biosynthesis protein Coq4